MTDFSSAITDDADQFSFDDIDDVTPSVVISQRAALHVAAETLDDVGLFDVERPPPVSLADRFVVPPFSILNRGAGYWQDRRRRWLSIGIKSEIGRPEGQVYNNSDPDCYSGYSTLYGTSVFDPVLCELVYRWFTKPGARVLDPFAGGSVRGIVASTLARWYVGVDIRQEQIAANRAQSHLGSDILPEWICGDATRLDRALADTVDDYDLVFSCPPYADLEVYSDHPRDISTWSYEEFLEGHRKAIVDACARLRPNRYAVWVIGDVRDKTTGKYYGLHHRAVEEFQAAGLHVVNECVLSSPLGTAPVRAAASFQANRKLALVHKHVLVFVKGDVRKAADWCQGRGLMARIRTIKPEFFTSPSTAAVDFPVRIFYQALWCAADDFGVGETNFNALLGLAFPDTDGFVAPDVRRFCADCARHFGTTFYAVRGRYYYAIPTWELHQKLESRSNRRRYPPPDDPGATPDLRIYDCADSAPETPRKSGAESRKTAPEHRNRGTGETGTEEEELTSEAALPAVSDPDGSDHRPIHASVYPQAFELWWKHYPRKDAKRQALEAWKRARKRATAEQLIEGAQRYAADPNREERFTKQPATWLNGDCWLSAPIPGNGCHPPATLGKPTQKALGWRVAADELIAEMSQP